MLLPSCTLPTGFRFKRVTEPIKRQPLHRACRLPSPSVHSTCCVYSRFRLVPLPSPSRLAGVRCGLGQCRDPALWFACSPSRICAPNKLCVACERRATRDRCAACSGGEAATSAAQLCARKVVSQVPWCERQSPQSCLRPDAVLTSSMFL
jgi:hypothetical protein